MDVNLELTLDKKYSDVVHCPRCMRRRLVLRYPGNDPENGPAIKWCGHCGLEVEPCYWCDLCWHEAKRPTPLEPYEHNSWGHGVPACDAEDAKYEEMMRNDLIAQGLCPDCADKHDPAKISCAELEEVRRAELKAGWDPNP